MTNSRNKGASFEREIGNLLTEDLGLKNNIRRILEQTREKHLPDLMLGRWYIECKRYGSGAEPLEAWWQQVLDATSEQGIPALVYKFDRRPIKVRERSSGWRFTPARRPTGFMASTYLRRLSRQSTNSQLPSRVH